MLFLNLWILLAFIPLYIIYTKHIKHIESGSTKTLFFSLLFMVLAIAQPVLKNTLQKQKFHSQEFIIALDASYSMQADDLKPSRYIVAKKAIKKLLSSHPKDRFTLFVFTSNALLISPPTTDTSLSILALDSINPEYILTKSTNLKHLFQTVSKLSMKRKKLIVFSDGGEEHVIQEMSELAKKNNITPYFVATATQKGAALKKSKHFIKDAHSALVISKINPALKELAKLSHGRYYELNSLDIMQQLSKDITQKTTIQTAIQVSTYKELYYLPLIIALILFFLAITKFGVILLFIGIMLVLPQKAEASFLDFHHLSKAKKFVQTKEYQKAIHEYKLITPSVQSYYNIASLYYKLGEYRDALQFYTQIQSTNPKIKQAIFYNMANCATKIKKYDRAKRFYRLSLAFSEDADALYNLQLLQKLHPKTPQNVVDMMPKEQTHKEAKEHQKTSKEKKNANNSSASSSSNQQSQESSHGGGSQKKKKRKSIKKSKTKNKSSNFKLGYKAYEKINKGYSDEKEPW